MTVRSALAALFLLVAGTYACAPPTLPADAQNQDDTGSSSTKKKKSTKSTGDDDDSTTSGDDDDSTTTAPTTTKKATTTTPATSGTAATSSVPPTFQAVYDALKPTCGSCHSNSPKFFGSDAASSYPLMKPLGDELETKGAHQGPDTTSDQKSKIAAWVAADP